MCVLISVTSFSPLMFRLTSLHRRTTGRPGVFQTGHGGTGTYWSQDERWGGVIGRPVLRTSVCTVLSGILDSG